MGAQGDVYQVKVTGTLLGELYNNVFWYRLKLAGEPITTHAGDLRNLFETFAWQPLMDGIMPVLDIASIEAINWNDLDDYAIGTSTANDGQYVGGDSAPGSVCITFQSVKPSPGKFYSYKRIGGVPQQNITGNTVSDTTTPTYQPFAVILGQNLAIPSQEVIFEHVQVKHSQTTAPYSKTDPYKMPVMGSGNPIVQRVFENAWSWRLGTQNSRKPGYGD